MSGKSRYTDSLTPGEALNGMRCCLRNADGLAIEASILVEHGRYPRAIALSLIAWEEMGKLPMLAGSPRYGDDSATWKKRLWKRFRNHADKLFLQEQVFPAKNDGSPMVPAGMMALAEVRERMLYADHNGSSFEAPEDVENLAHIAGHLIDHLKDALEFHAWMVEGFDEDSLVSLAESTPIFLEQARRELADAGYDEPIPDIEVVRALRQAGLDPRIIWEQVKARARNE
jgi:AbiV family abortive infection protein